MTKETKERKALESLLTYLDYSLELKNDVLNIHYDGELFEWLMESPITKAWTTESQFPLNHHKIIDDSNGNDLKMLFLDDFDGDERVLLINFEGITVWKNEQSYLDEEKDGCLHSYFYCEEV